jgi:hypothetical protein
VQAGGARPRLGRMGVVERRAYPDPFAYPLRTAWEPGAGVGT